MYGVVRRAVRGGLGHGLERFLRKIVVDVVGAGRGRPRTRDRLDVGRRQRPRLAPPRGGNPGSLVLVIRVERGAARLLHRILDHRDDRMVGDAALTRTVVVENVIETNPALLHELPRSRFPSGGIRPSTPARGALSAVERARKSAGCPGSVTRNFQNPNFENRAAG